MTASFSSQDAPDAPTVGTAPPLSPPLSALSASALPTPLPALLPVLPEEPLHTLVEEPGHGQVFGHGTHDTPFGPVFVWLAPRGVRGLSFLQAGGRLPDAGAALADARRQCPGARFDAAPADTAAVVESLFARPPGDGRERFSVSVEGSAFQVKVWRALLRIPAGSCVSYRTVAEAIGHPGASRAVGSAVGANPVSVLIPCHRVRRASGGLGGFGWGLPLKTALLTWELNP